MSHHGRAASRRADDVFVVLEDRQELFRQRLGVFRTASVCHRLPAAGLGGRIIDFTSESLEQFERCESHLRIKLIDITGNEQSNTRHQYTFLVSEYVETGKYS